MCYDARSHERKIRHISLYLYAQGFMTDFKVDISNIPSFKYGFAGTNTLCGWKWVCLGGGASTRG